MKEYSDGHDLIKSLRRYFDYYNNDRPHSSLDYKTPSEVYFKELPADSLRCACFGAALRESADTEKIGTTYTKYKDKIGLDNG